MTGGATRQAELAALLYQALAEPIGLVLRTSDSGRARQLLYQARTKAGDVALAGLQFRAWSGPGGDLVICKGQSPVVPTSAPRALPDLSELL